MARSKLNEQLINEAVKLVQTGLNDADVCDALGIPEETVLLMLLRPVSGSAALSAAADVISRCGADSLAGRTAAVMCSSSDTTFYVIAVYFTAARV